MGVLAGAVGWWLPWVLHPSGAAALVLLGLDLGEFFKFTPAGKNGELYWERHFFYLPPVLASLALTALLASQRRAVARGLLAIVAAFLAAVVLPPYPYSSVVLFSAEFRFQSYAALVALGAVALALVGPQIVRSSPTALLLLRIAIGLAGLALPVWAFWRVKLILDGLYGRPIVVGPGLFVTAGGFTLLAIAGLQALGRPACAAAPRRASPATSAAELNLHLLYIEDELDHRNLVAWVLSDAGWEVESVSTFEAARSLLQGGWPDLVLLDLQLGSVANGVGFETLQALKSEHPTLPVVVTSVSDFPDLVRRARDLGAAAFLRKPLDINTLDGNLRRLIAGA